MRNVFCVGELLIDFVCKDIGVTLVQGSNFQKLAGGAPANVGAAIAKLGGRTSFLGKVGDDSFGVFLEETLKDVDVDTSMMIKGNNTTLAFVSIDANGERDFTFLRGADGEYSFDNIDLSKIAPSDILHFGSATAWLPGDLKETYKKLLAYAKERGIFVSFDPNYRDALIKDVDQFRQDTLEFIANADFVKLSDEEAKMIAQSDDLDEAVAKLLGYGPKIVSITLGSKGTYLAVKDKKDILPSVKIKQVDSNGAGDAFVGAMLVQFSREEKLKEVYQDFVKLSQFVSFANKVGAITCTNYGAISSMPTPEDIVKFEH